MWRVVIVSMLLGCGGNAEKTVQCDPCPGATQTAAPAWLDPSGATLSCWGAPQCQGIYFKAASTQQNCDKAKADWTALQVEADWLNCLCNSKCATPPCTGC